MKRDDYRNWHALPSGSLLPVLLLLDGSHGSHTKESPCGLFTLVILGLELDPDGVALR